MKAKFIAITAIAVVSLASCKKDKKDEKNIVGTWKSTTVTSTEKENGVVVFDTTMNIDGWVKMTFRSDNTYTGTYLLGTDENGTYSINGSKLITTYAESGVTSSDTVDFSIAGDDMTVTDQSTEVSGGVTTQSEDVIKFKRQ